MHGDNTTTSHDTFHGLPYSRPPREGFRVYVDANFDEGSYDFGMTVREAPGTLSGAAVIAQYMPKASAKKDWVFNQKNKIFTLAVQAVLHWEKQGFEVFNGVTAPDGFLSDLPTEKMAQLWWERQNNELIRRRQIDQIRSQKC
jgi:hypothetical protein